MLTRCPACATSFRVTPEQLKLRAGKVRCGKCQTVFNAIDSLLESPVHGTTAGPVPTPLSTPARARAARTPARRSRAGSPSSVVAASSGPSRSHSSSSSSAPKA